MTVTTFVPKPNIDSRLIVNSYNIIDCASRHGSLIVAYSGGKDGLCAALLARDMGIKMGVCELSYTFTNQEHDIRNTASGLGVEVEWRRTLDMAWLAKHPKFVFSRCPEVVSAFCQIRQRDSVERCAKSHGHKVVITGRKKRGNSVRKAIDPRRSGTIGCHPIREWDDGDVWAFLRLRGVGVPWIYSTPFGKHEGNSAWPFCRQYLSRFENYEVIHNIEPKIVERAAEYGIVDAREFLQCKRR
jgi:3'-phosphoadenosine 5'-phosphosulfate sulfotransferase (PAPS reductase)/FAD synthetase